MSPALYPRSYNIFALIVLFPRLMLVEVERPLALVKALYPMFVPELYRTLSKCKKRKLMEQFLQTVESDTDSMSSEILNSRGRRLAKRDIGREIEQKKNQALEEIRQAKAESLQPRDLHAREEVKDPSASSWSREGHGGSSWGGRSDRSSSWEGKSDHSSPWHRSSSWEGKSDPSSSWEGKSGSSSSWRGKSDPSSSWEREKEGVWWHGKKTYWDDSKPWETKAWEGGGKWKKSWKPKEKARPYPKTPGVRVEEVPAETPAGVMAAEVLPPVPPPAEGLPPVVPPAVPIGAAPITPGVTPVTPAGAPTLTEAPMTLAVAGQDSVYDAVHQILADIFSNSNFLVDFVVC